MRDTGRRCLQCDYNLTGLTGGQCPECGWGIDEELVAFAAGTDSSGGRRALFVVLAALLAVWCFVPALLSLVLGGGVLAAPSPKAGTLVAGLCFVSMIAAGGLLASVAVLGASPTRRFPMHAPRLLRACRLVGWIEVLAASVLALVQTSLVNDGLVVLGITWTYWAFPGLVLLFAGTVAFTTPAESMRQMRSTLARRGAETVRSPPFTVEAAGAFEPDAVQVAWDASERPTNDALEALIDAAWREKLALAEQRKQLLYNGALGRLVSSAMDEGRLTLSIGATNYRDFLGTNLYNAAAVRGLGEQFLSNALGTTATVVTRDGNLAYGRRSERVAYHAGYLHTFGGTLEAIDQGPDLSFDVFAAVRRELREELGLADDEIVEMVCTGLVRDHEIMQPELLFDAAIKLSKAELLARFESAADDEHTALEMVDDDPEAIVPFLSRADRIAPVAVAAMMLHGRRCWGREWYENAGYLLFGELPPWRGKSSHDDANAAQQARP